MNIGTKRQVWEGKAMQTDLGEKKEDLMISEKGNIVKKRRGRKEGTLLDKKPNPWLIHLKKVRNDNPGIPYKDVIKKAKESYKKPSAKPDAKPSAKPDAKPSAKPEKKERLITSTQPIIDRMKTNAQALLKLKGQTSAAAKLAKKELKKEQAKLKQELLQKTK